MKRLWLAVALVAAILAGGGFAWAQVGDETVKACADRGGNLKLQTGDECPRGWTPVQWSVTGPQGPAGPTGATGLAGPQGPPGPASIQPLWQGTPYISTFHHTGSLCQDNTIPADMILFLERAITGEHVVDHDVFAGHNTLDLTTIDGYFGRVEIPMVESRTVEWGTGRTFAGSVDIGLPITNMTVCTEGTITVIGYLVPHPSPAD